MDTASGRAYTDSQARPGPHARPGRDEQSGQYEQPERPEQRDRPERPEQPDRPERPGLRELKKQRTRDALLHAALELFTTQGYEGTTVDQIAEDVGVSQRTFFRYFAGKEDAVFFVPRLADDHFVELLVTRPAGETPLEALRRATLKAMETLAPAVEEVVPLDLHLRLRRLIESTPALLAAHLRRATEHEQRVARILARREGVDVDRDPRPRIAVAVYGAVLRLTEQMWTKGEDHSLRALTDLTGTFLDQVRPALTGTWGKQKR
jgi:AcrR family transcriptional regulator